MGSESHFHGITALIPQTFLKPIRKPDSVPEPREKTRGLSWFQLECQLLNTRATPVPFTLHPSPQSKARLTGIHLGALSEQQP